MKRKRTPWPRWAKIVRNLLIFCLLIFAVWEGMGKPLPYEAALRRKVRQYMMPEMEYHAEISQGYWPGSIRADWTEGAAMLSFPAYGQFFRYPSADPVRLEQGTNLLCAPGWAFLNPGPTDGAGIYIAVFPPEDSVAARLILHNGEEIFTADAEREGNIFFFYTAIPSYLLQEGYSYELVFYDAAEVVVAS